MSFRPTAIGKYLLIAPYEDGFAVWAFSKGGQCEAGRPCKTLDEAVKARRKWRRLHEKLWAERQARRRKP